jgi:hypothetical protein
MPATTLQKLNVTMDDEYPILEHLIISCPLEDKSSICQFPETLQAPNLRHLYLIGFTLPIGSRLLTTSVGLVAPVYTWSTHPPTSIQISCSDGFHLCLSWRRSRKMPSAIDKQTPVAVPVAFAQASVLCTRSVQYPGFLIQ